MRFHFIANAHKKNFREIDISLKSFFLGGTYEKVRKNYKNVWGGVLVLSAILALSLTFASCANSSDSDDESPSPSLPENVGENPITKTIKLKTNKSNYLELRKDCTASYISEKEDPKTIVREYKYTYDEKKETITMRVEKTVLDLDVEGNQGQLLTYNEVRSKINEELTVEKMRRAEKEYYETYKNSEYIKEDYPDCDTYDKYEAAFLKKNGVVSFDDYVKLCKQEYESVYKAVFGAMVTYSYKITDDKMTLTEKFTGVKNMLDSRCEYSSYDGNQNWTDAGIGASYAYIRIYENDVRYSYEGTLDTDKKTIDFVKQKRTESDDGDYEYEALGNVTATYTEDISGKAVTINCEGKKYVCEFVGQKFVQE